MGRRISVATPRRQLEGRMRVRPVRRRALRLAPGGRRSTDTRAMTTVALPRLGLRANAGQFALLVAVNGLVGAMVGQERTVLPLLGQDVFGLTGYTVVLSFVLAFGVSKAVANLVAGAMADR